MLFFNFYLFWYNNIFLSVLLKIRKKEVEETELKENFILLVAVFTVSEVGLPLSYTDLCIHELLGVYGVMYFPSAHSAMLG